MIARLTAVAAFVGCVFGANWALNEYGFVQLVGPGDIVVPAGVYFAGFAFGARDFIHELADRRWVIAAILIGAACSYVIEPDFAVASGAAFLVSEFADYAVYAPLRRRRWTVAVIASNVVGSAVDSVLFLWLAFDSTDGWLDLTYGKALMIAPALAVMAVIRR